MEMGASRRWGARRGLACIALCAALIAGCGSDDRGFDASAPIDASQDAARPDAGGLDAADLDSSAPFDAATDAARDAGAAPLGTISGACGEIDDEELLSAEPFAFAGAFDFPTPPGPGYDEGLSAGARELLVEGTVGGSSIVSEAIAFEYLARCEMASLLLSESEVMYEMPDGGPAGLTDMVVELEGHRVGVSVVRGFVGGPDRETNPYDAAEATRILENKLDSIRASSDLVVTEHAWVKQILVVVALRPDIGATIESTWATFSDLDRDGTILVTVVTNGEDDFIYDNTLP